MPASAALLTTNEKAELAEAVRLRDAASTRRVAAEAELAALRSSVARLRWRALCARVLTDQAHKKLRMLTDTADRTKRRGWELEAKKVKAVRTASEMADEVEELENEFKSAVAKAEWKAANSMHSLSKLAESLGVAHDTKKRKDGRARTIVAHTC
mmetsp:Transcript_28552/g.74980  ORF Transcript_28552/g.74980 Transcript_28552/m.74980 type:complete len:155 (+) Transcript_28552:296-760(+)